MASKRYPIDGLIKWQDDILEVSKKNLRKDGYLRSTAFFLTEAMNLDEDLKHKSLALDKDTDGKIHPVAMSEIPTKPTDTIVVVLDLAFGPEQVIEILKECNPPEIAALLTNIEEQGRKMGASNPSEILGKAILSSPKMNIKNIITMAIENVIRRTEAIAYIKVDEAWTIERKENEESGNEDLSMNPNSKEAIMSLLETDGYTRAVSVPFRRNRPKTGRIIGFDPHRISVEGENGGSLTGRFAHLFDKAKSHPKPAVTSTAN